MNTFGQAFGFGFMSGLFNNMFSPFGMFNNSYFSTPFFANYSLFTPTFTSFNQFMPSQNYTDFSMPSFQNYTPSYNTDFTSIWNTSSNYSVQNQNSNTQSLISQQRPLFNINSFYHNTPTLYITPVNTPKYYEEKKPPVGNIKISDEKIYPPPITTDAKTMTAKWNKKLPKATNITEEFCQKVIDISKEIKCNPEDLMAIMNLESGKTFRPDVQNFDGEEYYGLIQFGESAAIDVEKSLNELRSMSAIEQLDYVKKYLLKQKKHKHISNKTLDTKTLYCLVLYPSLTNASDNAIFAQNKGNSIKRYERNKGLDQNNDGKITRGELDKALDLFRA